MNKVIPVKLLFVAGVGGLALVVAVLWIDFSQGPLLAVRPSLSASTSTPASGADQASSTTLAPNPPAAPSRATSSPASNPPLYTPAAAQTPPLQPSAAAGISIGDDFNGLSSAQLNAELDDMRSMGVSYLRFDLDWSVVERRQGRDDWSVPDRIVAAVEAHNLIPLPILDFTPTWARLGACSDTNRCEPADPEDYANFAHAAAQRYTSQGVHDWEIWNEPNDTIFWQPAPDADVYSQMLQESYNAIKNVDPSATVLVGGMAAVSGSDGNIPPVEFLKELYDTGAGGHFDAVAFHPYSFPDLPGSSARGNPWLMMADTNPSLLSLMQAHGDGNKKIWITEYGAPTGGPQGISEALQAETISDAFAQIKDATWAGPLFIYTYKDASTDQDTSENFYGLLRADGSQKPGYQAFKDSVVGQ